MKTILFNGHDLKFLTHIINFFERQPGYRVLIDEMPGHTITNKERSSQLLKEADLIFCEWALGNAEWYSKHKLPGQKLVIRLHHQEINLKYLKTIDYPNVDRIVFICQENMDIFLERFSHLKEKCTLIYNVIDCDLLDQQKLPESEFNLGFIGSSPKRKAPHHALGIFNKLKQIDSRYTLSFKGKHPWEYPWLWQRNDEKLYYNRLYKTINSSQFVNAILFDPHGNDMPEWFTKIGFILSTSDHEGSHQAIAEGMAAGSVPIIRNWAGADTLYPKQFIVKSEDEAIELIVSMQKRETYLDAVKYIRQFAKNNFDISVITAAYEKMFNELLGIEVDLEDTKSYISADSSDKLKVLHICFLKPGSQSGYEVRVIEETKVLVSLGVRVFIAAFISPAIMSDNGALHAHSKKLREMSGAEIKYFPTSHFFDLDVTKELSEEIDGPLIEFARKQNITIIHGQALYSGNHAIRIAKSGGFKVVFDNHGISPEENEMTGGSAHRVMQLSGFEKKVLKEADLTIVVSEAMNNFYKTKYGFKPNPSQLIPCCVHPENFIMADEDRIQKRNLKGFKDKFILLYMGTLSIWQWPDAIFKMFKRFNDNYAESILYLLIPTYDHELAKKYIESYNLAPGSYILEEVAHNDVGKVIGIADAGILLRKNHPVNFVSSPTKFGEYLAAGLPVIITQGIGDYSDLTNNHKVGITINIDSEQFDDMELKRLIDFAEHVKLNRKQWAEKCNNFALERLNWYDYGKSLKNSYESLL